ncbi:hypothetical protein ABZ477_02630 [Microbacterium sp. NPDC019599]|uniref:hypothetical protein n=1 Tax=Microbacterium sp. NPDC019599 TaxID=3154690 RepID=UPI0033DB560F
MHQKEKSDRVGRAIHLIDIENLCACGRPTIEQIEWVRAEYVSRVGLSASDLVIIASAHANAVNVHRGWSGARQLIGSGPDGADLCLLGVMIDENLAERFEKIYVGSGDHIFSEQVARLAGDGSEVSVVSEPHQLARTMRMAAHHVLYFPANPFAAALPA